MAKEHEKSLELSAVEEENIPKVVKAKLNDDGKSSDDMSVKPDGKVNPISSTCNTIYHGNDMISPVCITNEDDQYNARDRIPKMGRVEERATLVARKRNLEGLLKIEDRETMVQGALLVKKNAALLMSLCNPLLKASVQD